MLRKLNSIRIANKIGIAVFITILTTFTSISTIGYTFVSNHIEKAAGIELIGCANITLGLFGGDEIKQLVDGDTVHLSKIEQATNWTVQQKGIFDAQYILGLDGTLLAASDTVKARGYEVGKKYYLDQEATMHVNQMKHPFYSEVYEYNGEKRMSGYAPIFYNNEIIAYNVIDFEGEVISGRTWDMLQGILIITAVPMLLGTGLLLWLVVVATRPLKKLSDFTQNVAKGNLNIDLLNVKNQDDVGRLTNDVNHMVNSIRKLIVEIDGNSSNVKKTSEGITYTSNELKQTTKSISNSIQNVVLGTDEQVLKTQEVNGVVDGFLSDTKEISIQIEHIEELSNNANSKANEGNEVVIKAVKQMEFIEEKTNDISEIIHVFEQSSNEIGRFVELISGFSEQTNLLALNASIEAARAGEHGKGFAVVASEVRKLAEQSNQASSEIQTLVHEIQNRTKQAIGAVESGKVSVKVGLSLVGNTGKNFEEIMKSIKVMTNEISGFSGKIINMNEGIEYISESIEGIAKIAYDTTSNAQNVLAASEETAASMNEFAKAVTLLDQMSSNLEESISYFKIED